MSEIGAFIKETPESQLDPPTVREHSKGAPSVLGSRPPPDAESANTLTLNLEQ